MTHSGESNIGWWITTGPLDGTGGRPLGRKVLGPFVSRDLAIEVRSLYEKVHAHEGRYWLSPVEEG